MKKLSVLFTMLMCCGLAVAGGLNPIGGMGPRAGAMSGAYNAIADDASLFYYNIAGMSDLGVPYAELSASALWPKFEIDHKLRHNQESRGDVMHILPLAGYVQPINEDLSIGIGMTTPFAMGANFAPDLWYGRFGSETLISLTNLTPAVSLRLNDDLFLGLGLNIGRTDFNYQAPFDIWKQPLPLTSDSRGNGWGLGGIVSLRWLPNDRFRLGLTYMSEERCHISGTTDLGRGILTQQLDFDSKITFPEKIGVGMSYQATSHLLLALDVNWWGYSDAFKHLTLDFEGIPYKKTCQMNWQDNYSVNLGARYRLNDDWWISGGVGYLENAIPDTTVSQMTPDASGYDVSAGIHFDNGDLQFNAHVIYGWADRQVDWKPGNSMPGDYSIETLTVGASVSYMF